MDFRESKKRQRAQHAELEKAQRRLELLESHGKPTDTANHGARAERATREAAAMNDENHHNFKPSTPTTLQGLKGAAGLFDFDIPQERARREPARDRVAHKQHPFHEPPSSTGSHATITTSSLNTTSTFSVDPIAESTRVDTYQPGRHRVMKSTGRFAASRRVLENVANTSALRRTFPEWDATKTGTVTKDVETIELDPADDKENQAPRTRQQRAEQKPVPAQLLSRQIRQTLQATVQDGSDASTLLSAARARPLPPAVRSQTAGAKEPVDIPAKADGRRKSEPSSPVRPASPLALLSRQSPPSRGQRPSAPEPDRKAPAMDPTETSALVHVRTRERDDNYTAQSMTIPSSKSYPHLHDLVSGALRCASRAFFYGDTGRPGHQQMLDPEHIPEDERKIFVSLEKIQEELISLQEHDEMLQKEADRLQNELDELQSKQGGLSQLHTGERVPQPADSAIGSESVQSLKETHDQEKEAFAQVIDALERELEDSRSRDKARNKTTSLLVSQRDAALQEAASAFEQWRRVQTELDSANEHIKQLEQETAERDEVINAMMDEKTATSDQHREECRRLQDRIAQLQREKEVLAASNSDRYRDECRRLQDRVAHLQGEKEALAMENEVLIRQNTVHEEHIVALRQRTEEYKKASRTAAKTQKSHLEKINASLREKKDNLHQLDHNYQSLDQSYQGLEQNYRSLGQSYQKLKENYQRLRASFEEKDETLSRAVQVLDQWPGGLPDDQKAFYKGKAVAVPAAAETGGPSTREQQAQDNISDDQSFSRPEEEEDELPAGPSTRQQPERNSGGRISPSAVPMDDDAAMDENMTSQFFLDDITYEVRRDAQNRNKANNDAAKESEEEKPANDDASSVVSGESVQSEAIDLPMPEQRNQPKPTENNDTRASQRTETLHSERSRHVRWQTLTFEAQARHRNSAPAAAEVRGDREEEETGGSCKTHDCLNCVQCYMIARRRLLEETKITVPAPKPRTTLGQQQQQRQRQQHQQQQQPQQKQQQQLLDPALAPGKALAIVIKALRDEVAHLHGEAAGGNTATTAATTETMSGRRRPSNSGNGMRKSRTQPSVSGGLEVHDQIEMKQSQICGLEQIYMKLEEEGEGMTREEMDVTMTKILTGGYYYC